MRNRNYWKEHYVIEEIDADEIERNIKLTHFVSAGKELLRSCSDL